MTASRVMTVRIEPALLEGLRSLAQADGRSVSGEIVQLVHRELRSRPRRAEHTEPTMGWLASLEVPADLREFRRVRRALSRRLAARTLLRQEPL
jgi:hypothetical protein